ncbi:hypothetical protein DUNSADRAFT_750 [Dunaliella salina]|uniref:Encoded protein n=1 Tax=Dunaliella salina TaxID=3046 RepID=A0ABQ7GXX9_DUNSA|nr:hypothetical protein DUNSADRAFT_750 [Dunaliella salina]|eukprot:KAF5839464.1 hypothetical protein DUNSADRAFT_750 [Dunaliella salina]
MVSSLQKKEGLLSNRQTAGLVGDANVPMTSHAHMRIHTQTHTPTHIRDLRERNKVFEIPIPCQGQQKLRSAFEKKVHCH